MRDPWARIAALDAAIASCHSATTALEAWCRADRNGAGETVRVRRLTTAEQPATSEQRARLAVGPGEPIVYRRVQIVFGAHVLSEASNWFVPGRLTPGMNRQLSTSDAPFGRVVAELAPTRRTFDRRALIPPRGDAIPVILFEHRALLVARDGRPIAEVDEGYTRDLLDLADPEGVLSRSSLVAGARPNRGHR